MGRPTLPSDQGVTVESLLHREANIFDFLRCFAAVLVIYSHSYALASFEQPLFHSVTPGQLGVRIFFILSGLLIAASWSSHARVAAFLGKRLLRILPALTAVIAGSVFIVGPLFTELSLKQYFGSNQTYEYLNGISVFGITYDLPGVFTHNKFAEVNGSLWTLPLELFAYLLVAFLGRSGLLKKKVVALGSWLGCAAMYFVTSHFAPQLVVFNMNISLLTLLLTFFLAGVVLFVYRRQIRLVWWGALLCLIALLLPLPGADTPLIPFVALPYLVLWVGSLVRTGFQRLERYGDFSYGLYIFAWPVQQAIVQLHVGSIGHNRLFVYSFAVTLALAIGSWYLVEKPMLKLKTHFSSKRYPLTSDAW